MKDNTSPLGFFERYLTIWVALCIAGGVGIGVLMGERMQVLSDMNLFGINLPITVLVWLMIFPMMLAVDCWSIPTSQKRLLLPCVGCWKTRTTPKPWGGAAELRSWNSSTGNRKLKL